MALVPVSSNVSLLENNYISTSAVVVALLAYQDSNAKHRCIQAARSPIKTLGRTVSSNVVTNVPRLLLGFSRSAFLRLKSRLFQPLVSIQIIFKSLYDRLRHLLIPWWHRRPLPYSTYPTREAEQQYWDSARVFRRKLQSSDARLCTISSSNNLGSQFDWYEERVPVISSYQPALPPLHASRNAGTSLDLDKEGLKEYYLPTKAFCKWHRMTFPDQPPLDPVKASRMKQTYNSMEKREIHRISRLVSNKKAFRTDGNLLDSRRYFYRDMWDAWQEKHSLDVEVIFEAE